MPSPVKAKVVTHLPPTSPRSQPRSTVWKGPEVDGITQSLLSRFLTCRERFRLLVVEGLRPADQFNHHIEYGQMWHICEEALSGGTQINGRIVGIVDWETPLKKYVHELSRRYPTAVDQIDKWYNVCKVQFPVYQQYWAKHKDNDKRQPVGQEIQFNVPYRLPSGRTIRLRGKIDAVDCIGSGKAAALYQQENKTKSDPHEDQIKRQLTFDLQSMMYLTALQVLQRDKKLWAEHRLPESFRNLPIGGIRYNVIRRPLSGGTGSIKQHKPTKKNPLGESKESYYGRLRAIIDGTGEDTPGPDYFFMRWRAEVPPSDITRFQHRFLNPILENLCSWWNFVELCHDAALHPCDSTNNDIHWQHPFGVRNMLDEGGSTDLDEYLTTGSTVGLERVETLFTELA